MATTPEEPQAVQARLGLWDAISIVVGIIIGVGIYKTNEVFAKVDSPAEAMGLWVLGGVLSLIGALCFAELASTYPRSGGEYVYLSRAYGSWVGFLFAWAQLLVIRSGGGIALLAYVFGDYATYCCNLGTNSAFTYAVLAIVILTAINILGVYLGKETQNVLTLAKVLGLGGLVVAGLFLPPPAQAPAATAAERSPSLMGALVALLFAYDGWNEAANVTAEVRNPRRNLPLALIGGTLAVTIIYLLVNDAYLTGLGFDAASRSETVAADLMNRILGPSGGIAMSVLVMISALGGINGTIFTGSRIYAEMGKDYWAFAPLGHWSPRFGTPVWSLLAQGLVSLSLVVIVGVWGSGANSFETLLNYTTPVFWFFFLLTAASLFVLRFKDRAIERPFRVPAYPWVPIIFCGFCAFMLYSSFSYAPTETVIGLVILLTGLPLGLLSRRSSVPANETANNSAPVSALPVERSTAIQKEFP
jgi:amino acid transporter